MNYNSEDYIKLLKLSQFLDDNEMMSLKCLNRDEYLRLLNYSSMFNDHYHWKCRNEYWKLITDFTSYKLEATQFDSMFRMKIEAIETECRNLKNDIEKLKSIEVDSRSYGIAKWLSEIYLFCSEFSTDPEVEYCKNEVEFRESVQALMPEVEKYLQD